MLFLVCSGQYKSTLPTFKFLITQFTTLTDDAQTQVKMNNLLRSFPWQPVHPAVTAAYQTPAVRLSYKLYPTLPPVDRGHYTPLISAIAIISQ